MVVRRVTPLISFIGWARGWSTLFPLVMLQLTPVEVKSAVPIVEVAVSNVVTEMVMKLTWFVVVRLVLVSRRLIALARRARLSNTIIVAETIIQIIVMTVRVAHKVCGRPRPVLITPLLVAVVMLKFRQAMQSSVVVEKTLRALLGVVRSTWLGLTRAIVKVRNFISMITLTLTTVALDWFISPESTRPIVAKTIIILMFMIWCSLRLSPLVKVVMHLVKLVVHRVAVTTQVVHRNMPRLFVIRFLLNVLCKQIVVFLWSGQVELSPVHEQMDRVVIILVTMKVSGSTLLSAEVVKLSSAQSLVFTTLLIVSVAIELNDTVDFVAEFAVEPFGSTFCTRIFQCYLDGSD